MSHAFIVCGTECQTKMPLEYTDGGNGKNKSCESAEKTCFSLAPTEITLLRYKVLICFPPHTFRNNGIPLVTVRLPH